MLCVLRCGGVVYCVELLCVVLCCLVVCCDVLCGVESC